MIKIKDIQKTYYSKNGGACTAVDGVSLEFDQTGLVFIVGKSGSGKSTLLNLMSGMDRPDSGDIWIAGKSTQEFVQNDFDVYRNTYVGYVFQDFGLIDELNVGHNIALSLQLQGVSPTDEQILEVLSKVGLGEYMYRRASELSGGQRQRVSIARALLKQSKIVFADEPTGSLDAVTGRQIFDIFKDLSKTSLVIIVSHDMESALRYADRIITLSDGKVVSDNIKSTRADLDALKAEYDEKVNQAFLPYQHIRPDDTQKFETIKTALPFKVASRMSMSNIKSTKVRFIFAILLSMIALALFCIVDTMRGYSYEQATFANIKNTGINTVFLTQYKEIINERGESNKEYTELYRNTIQSIQNKFGEVYQTIPLQTEIISYIESERNTQTNQLVEMNFDKLNQYYSSSILPVYDADGNAMSRVPSNEPNSNFIEVMISDYTADLIMTVGGIFNSFAIDTNNDSNTINSRLDNGVVLPNTGYDYIINQQYTSNNITFKIVGIYFTNYKSLLDPSDKSAKTKSDFFRNYVCNNLLVQKDALQNYMNAQIAVPLDMTVNYKPSVRDYQQNLITINTEILSIENLKYLDLASHSANGIFKWQDGTNQPKELEQNEIIISYETLGGIKDWQFMPQFDDLKPDDFAYNLNTQFSASLLQSQRTPYAHPIKIVGVFDSSQINIALLQLLYPNLNYGDLANLVICSKESQQDFIYDSMIFSGAYMSLNLNGNGTKVLQELSSIKIDAMTYMMQDIAFIDQLFTMLSSILGYTSIGLFLFVIFLVFNFMSSSVSNKKREIGILRVMGAKGRDTAKIFIIEGLILFAITAVITIIATILGISFLNTELTSRFTTISTVIVIGPLTILLAVLAFAASIFVASALPLWRIIRLRPIEAVKS